MAESVIKVRIPVIYLQRTQANIPKFATSCLLYTSTSPLGLSEWIKVAGMFIGKEEEACQLFAQMEPRYNLLKAKVSNVKQRPSVFSGEMRRDTPIWLPQRAIVHIFKKMTFSRKKISLQT